MKKWNIRKRMGTDNWRLGRSPVFFRNSPGGILPRTSLISLLAYSHKKASPFRWLLPPLLYLPVIVSCSKDKVPDVAFRDRSDVQSVQSVILLENSCEWAAIPEFADVYIYSDKEVRTLEFKGRFSSCDSIFIRSTEAGDKMVAVIAGARASWDNGAFDMYDSLESLEYRFDDETTAGGRAVPLMTGSASFKAGDICHIRMAPLMARVVLSEVTNNMDGYRRLENPSVRLCAVNAQAQIFRGDGFRPKEFIDTGQTYPLPCDVGMFTQYPETELFCYPNDSGQSSIGTPRTRLEFLCEIKGNKTSFQTELPPIPRNSTTRLSLCVEDDLSYEFRLL